MSTVIDLEEALVWEDMSELSSRPLTRDQSYIFVDSLNRKYRKPPVNFSISITSIDGDYKKTSCRPGSTFAGHVQLNIDYPLAAQCLRLLFKATEQILHDNKKENEILFSVRTIVWGLPSVSGSQWPMMNPGNHRFQFLCELPQVNYSPTFRHHLASCDFELLASLERPGTRPFQTVPVYLTYQPLVLTNSLKSPHAYQEQTSLSNHTITILLPKGCSYNLLDTYDNRHVLDLCLLLGKRHASLHIDVSLRKEVHVSRQQPDIIILSHVDSSSFRTRTTAEGRVKHFVQIPISTENSSFARKGHSGITPSLTEHSKNIHIVYKLVVTVKIRNGLRSQKQTLFSIPLQLGTLPPGVQVPSNVLSYTSLPSDTTLKPRFLYVPSDEEQLPAYRDEISPPLYS